MKSLKQLTIAALLTAVTIHASGTSAQTASGTAPASCTQNGQTLTCVTTTTYNLPTGLNLQGQTTGSSFALSSDALTPTAPSGCAVAPASLSVALGATPSLSVACRAGSGSYTYQWTKNGTNIIGATSQAYTLTAGIDTPAANTATYSVLVVNSLGSNLASAATVAVSSQTAAAPGSCSVTPASASVNVGGSQTLSASCATGTAPFSFAWYKNNALIGGANSSTYTLTSSDTASPGSQTYRVDIANSAGNSGANGTVNVNAASAACTSSGSAHASIDVNVGYKQVGSSNLFGTGNTYIIRLDVGANSTTAGGLTALISHTEGVASQRAPRNISLSPCAGDFTSSAAVMLATNSGGSTAEISINDLGRGVPNVTTGTWYVNIKNAACSPSARCDVLVDWLHY